MPKATMPEVNLAEYKKGRLETYHLLLVYHRNEPLSKSLITFSNPRNSMRQWVETTYTLTHNDATLNIRIVTYSIIWEHLSVMALKQTYFQE